MATYTVGIDAATLNLTIDLCSISTQDTVLVPPGTYNMTVAVDCEHSSGWTFNAIIRGTDPNNRPVINGVGIASGFGVNTGLGYQAGSTGTLKFQDVIFEQFNALAQGVVYNPSSVVQYENVLFRDCASPVIRWLTGSATRQATAKKVKFLRTGIGIRTSGTSSYITIENCDGYFDLNSDAIIGGLGEVKSCSFSINSTSGSINAVACADATNVSVKNRGSTASTGVSCTGTYKNCNTFGTFSTQASGTNGGGNVLSSDPLYTDEVNGDFTPQTGSPLIDAGFTDGTVTDDIIGTARPQGANYDIGSVEKITSTTYSSITPVDIDTVVLNLTTSVTHDATAETEANYTITETTGTPVTVANASPNANPMSSIELTTSVHTNGATYNLAWSGITGLTDGNANYVAIASMPEISSATMTGKRVVRVIFSRPMLDDAELIDVNNYTLTPSSVVSSVVRVNSTTVDVTFVTELKNATPSIAIAGPTDLASNAVNDSISFSNPYGWISAITVTQDNEIRITVGGVPFDYLNPQVVDEANYVITRNAPLNGVNLVVSEVIPNVNGLSITLTLDREQTTGQSYSLTISNVDDFQ